MSDKTTVQVALRVRPLLPNEIRRGCGDILEVFPSNQQVQIKNSDKAFTYSYVFDDSSCEETIFNTCIKDIIKNLFEGYNVTVLAYGQTGSGKTHTMGTNYVEFGDSGIIPRSLEYIFDYVNTNPEFNFAVSVSFVELYREILYDLLTNKPRDKCRMEIREDNTKSIIIPGLTEQPVSSTQNALEWLYNGSQRRMTGSTNMNEQSSRSHAVFTIYIVSEKKDDRLVE